VQSRGIHHLGLVVSDVERSKRFHSELLRGLGWAGVLDLKAERSETISYLQAQDIVGVHHRVRSGVTRSGRPSGIVSECAAGQGSTPRPEGRSVCAAHYVGSHDPDVVFVALPARGPVATAIHCPSDDHVGG